MAVQARKALLTAYNKAHAQVPLEGTLERGGVACVLAAPGGRWFGRQQTGEPRSDFFISTRHVGVIRAVTRHVG